MKKYYYYTYKNDKFYGMGITCSDDSCFPLSETLKSLQQEDGVLTVIDFWHEISADEYYKISKLVNNQRNESNIS